MYLVIISKLRRKSLVGSQIKFRSFIGAPFIYPLSNSLHNQPNHEKVDK